MKKQFFILFIIIFALIVVNFFLNNETKAATTCGESYTQGELIYGTVLGADGKCWLDRNLGATQVATAYNDSASYGWIFQWGRGTDGHQIPTSGKTSAACSTDVPGHANFIKALYPGCGACDWRDPQNDNLWQGVDGINNPCPTGFRLPAIEEWTALISSAGITNIATAFDSSLKLTAGGYRGPTSGTYEGQSNVGYYWSSSVAGTSAYDLKIDSSNVSPHNYQRTVGFSVRCLADSPPACTEDIWSCSSWGACSTSGNQTRSCTKTYDCSAVNTLSPVTTQSCTYTAPICTSWTYSNWGTCSAGGQQARTIASSSPNNCTGGNPVLSQSCTYISSCASSDWSCTNWNTCSLGGTQTRTCNKISNCQGGVSSPAISQSCTYTPPICTSWTYSGWGACSSSGQQTRTIASSSPSNCTGGSPVTTQSCTYTAPTCTSWTYSNWGACSTSGQQTRNIISSSPSDCSGGNPILSQSCNYAPICTTNNWSCNSWSSCSTNGTQNRTCNKTSNCEGGVPSPVTTQSCTYAPPCNADTWECGSWNSCSSSGLQSRQCIITNDCQSANTPSPNTTQSCQYVPSCKADTWECGAWSSCSPNGIQARSCSKTYDCPSVENAPPETSQNCTPPNKPSTDTSSQQLTNQDSIIKSTVKLLCGNEYKWLLLGSGTVIGSNGLILTNKHVIDGCIGCLVAFVKNASDIPNFTNSSPVAGILKVSSYEDMAVLKIINYNVSSWIDVTKGNSSNLHLNDRVNIYGYPDEEYYGKTITSTSGDFSGYGTGANSNYLKTTAMMDHGVSGGGTYLNDGTFIGIATGGYSTGSSFINYALSINTIKSWLTSNSIYANSVYSKSDYSKNYSILTESNTNNIALLSIAKVNVLIYSNELKSKILPHSTDIAQNNNKPVFVIQNLSDIEGYYVYFGDNIAADVVKDGQFISKNEFSPEIISTNGTYYFIFKAKDKQGILSDVNITPYVYGTINTTKSSGATVNSVVAEEKKLTTKIDNNLSKRMNGNILLQVEKNGEGWYVNPDNQKKYYLGRPADAFSIMRNLGLGIKHSELTGYINAKFPSRLSGKILIDVNQMGEAWYISPKDKKAYFLGNPSQAFSVMRELGLGITNTDIRKIDVGEIN